MIFATSFMQEAKNAQQLELTIVSGDQRETVAFNTTEGCSGWNDIGEFELTAGDVKVELSDETDGFIVIADAMAWSPAD